MDYAGWTTGRAGTVPTDSSVRSYDGAGHRTAHGRTRTGEFDYASGTVYDSRDPLNPPSAPGAAKVTVTLGVDGDGLGNCTLTFIQPGPGFTPGEATSLSATCSGQRDHPRDRSANGSK